MNGFEKRAAKLKEKILKSTLEMLKTWEPKRIRIADIAKQAHVSQVTIYNHFGSKEDLLREAFKDYVRKIIEEYEAYMNGDYTFKEKFEYILFRNKQTYRLFPVDFFKELFMDDHELQQYVEEHTQRVTPLITRLINEGIENGEISNKISIPTVLSIIRMYSNHAKELLEIANQSSDSNAFFEEMTYLFLYGICGKE